MSVVNLKLIKIFSLFAFCIAILLISSGWSEQKEIRILVFSKTEGYKHESITAGTKMLIEAGKRHGFHVDTTKNASNFNYNKLKEYQAIVFLNTTGDVLDNQQQKEFEKFIQSGGGFVGIHSAADTEYDWPWYGKLVGGYFKSHVHVVEATVDVVDRNHMATKHLPKKWVRADEWYDYKSLNPQINVLATLDENTYEGGKNGNYHPIAWYHKYDGGRAFYTGGGHTNESFNSEPYFVKHVVNGILWAAGEDLE